MVSLIAFGQDLSQSVGRTFPKPSGYLNVAAVETGRELLLTSEHWPRSQADSVPDDGLGVSEIPIHDQVANGHRAPPCHKQ